MKRIRRKGGRGEECLRGEKSRMRGRNSRYKGIGRRERKRR